MTKSTICLNMIVKNESHIILSTLKNVLEHINIDYWVISDTGSTDDTIDIIKIGGSVITDKSQYRKIKLPVLRKRPAMYVFQLLSVVMVLALSLPIPHAFLARNISPSLSYLAKKISLCP